MAWCSGLTCSYCLLLSVHDCPEGSVHQLPHTSTTHPSSAAMSSAQPPRPLVTTNLTPSFTTNLIPSSPPTSPPLHHHPSMLAAVQVDAGGKGGPAATLIGGLSGNGSGASPEEQLLIDRLLPFVPFDWETAADNEAVQRYYGQVGLCGVGGEGG